MWCHIFYLNVAFDFLNLTITTDLILPTIATEMECVLKGKKKHFTLYPLGGTIAARPNSKSRLGQANSCIKTHW